MTVFSFWLNSSRFLSGFYMGKNQSNATNIEDLENKVTILGGDFNLFLDSAYVAEGVQF